MALAALGALLLAAPGRPLAAQPRAPWRHCLPDTTRAPGVTSPVVTLDTVLPGVTYDCRYLPQGPWLVHVARIDLRDPALALDAVRALDRRLGRERVSAMAARRGGDAAPPVVAINADFFDLRTGEVENNHVVAGDWVKGVMATDSPHDAFPSAHAQFAIDAAGRPRLGRFALRAAAMLPDGPLPLVGLNYRPPRGDGAVLYTPWYGDRTLHDTTDSTPPAPRDPDAAPPGATPPAVTPQQRQEATQRAMRAAARRAVEFPLRLVHRAGDTLEYAVLAPPDSGGGAAIPADGAVLSATGESAVARLRGAARPGARLRIVADLEDSAGVFLPRAAVGGWGRVVAHGDAIGGTTDAREGTRPPFSQARHPRSAIGLSRDSTQLLLAVVDGRRPWSVGMSLAEWGELLLALGAHDAMNLDGGGSSTLWIAGTVVNYPSDPTGERPVGNALVVRRRAR